MNTFINQIVQNGLLLDEIIHGLIGIPAAIFLWHKTKSKKIILLFYLSLYMIDVDHLIDYWVFHQTIRFDLIEFMGVNYFRQKGFALIPFHGWEWSLVFFAFVKKKGWKSIFAPLALAFLVHPIWDAIRVGSFLFYSLTFRFLTGFSLPNY